MITNKLFKILKDMVLESHTTNWISSLPIESHDEPELAAIVKPEILEKPRTVFNLELLNIYLKDDKHL